MNKKFIEIDGKKHYINDEDIKTEGEGEGEGEEGKNDGQQGGEDKIDEQAKRFADIVSKNLNLKEISEKIDKLFVNNSNADKLNNLKKDIQYYVDNKERLTKEEKVIGFYKAIVQNDKIALKALSEGTAADGGYLFPDEFRAELIRWAEEEHRMRSLVLVVPMRKDIMNMPSLLNSVKVYWTAENAEKTTTTAAFSQKTLTARKVSAILYASDELIEDAEPEFSVVQLIVGLFGEAIADEEDHVITAGNGTTQPTGITAVTAGHTQACSGNLDFDDIINLVYSLPQKYHKNARFLVHRNNIRELRKLKDNDGRYLWADPISKEGLPTILGYEVVENNWVSEASIYFGDWKKAYMLGDRKLMSVKVTQDTDQCFKRDETGIRVVERIGGYPVLADAYASLTSIP